MSCSQNVLYTQQNVMSHHLVIDGDREPMLFQGVSQASLTSTHGEILQDVGLEFQQMLLGDTIHSTIFPEEF